MQTGPNWAVPYRTEPCRTVPYHAVEKRHKWIVDAVMLAYSSLGLQCPIGVRAHSTRGIASSWAWSSGVSITEICTAAGWATPSTFARFYNLDIPALQARVLSALMSLYTYAVGTILSEISYIYIYIYAFSRRFYPKRLTVYRLYICIVRMCVPWESNPQPLRC